jgi:hypothetical protein
MNRPPVVIAAALLSAACASSSQPAMPIPTTPEAVPATPGAAPRAAAGATATPPVLRWGVFSGRYHMSNELRQVQEMMGQTNEMNNTSNVFVSAGISAQGANFMLSMTIDSATSSNVQAGDPSALRGKSVSLVVTPTGEVVSMSLSDSTSDAFRSMASGLRDFLPILPARTDAGTTWADSATVDMPLAMGLTLSRTARNEHRVVGWEDRQGTRALHITTTTAYSVSGTGEMQGQMLEFSGSGRSVADRFVSAAGVYLGGTESDSSTINVNVVSMGMNIPVRTSSRSTVTRLP